MAQYIYFYITYIYIMYVICVFEYEDSMGVYLLRVYTCYVQYVLYIECYLDINFWCLRLIYLKDSL